MTDKGYFNGDLSLQYCINHSHKLHPIQGKLIKATMEHPDKLMLGAIEVIQTCTCLLKQINGKKVLDVGLFTGFSALSWALAIPQDGHVISMDITTDDYDKVGKKLVEESGQAHKIDIRIQPALKTMDELIASGQSGTFDFVFLDAEKREYPQYYEKCMQLLRPGGIIAVDNALWSGEVVHAESGDEYTIPIDKLNKMIANDPRVYNVLLAIGDGLNLVFKK